MKRRLWVGAAGLAILAIAIALWSTRATTGHDGAASSTTTRSTEPTLVATRDRMHAMPHAIGQSTLPDPELGIDGLSHDDPVTAYRKANVYPPGSRPLSREHVDLLRPNQRHETWRPTDADDGVAFLFTADRYFAFGDDVITSTLETRGAAQVQITAALVATADPAMKPVPITYTQQGGTWVARFSPATLHLAKQSELGMYIEFDTGKGRQRSHYNVQYTPAAATPARFTGNFADTIAQGSLVVAAGLDVTAAGHYVIDCNLYDAADAPVAWVHWKGDLAPGTHDALLQFFGKVITDAGAHGPFHIGQLRGARFVPGQEPDLEQIPPYAGTFTTHAYAADDFSDAEYDSAEKQRMLQFLGEQDARGVHRGAAGHGTPGVPGDDH